MPDPLTSERREGLAGFYRAHHARVTRIVASRACGTAGTMIDDACAFAWLSLARRDDVSLDARGVQWVITVATHEAWRLKRDLDLPAGLLVGDRDERFVLHTTDPAGDVLERAVNLDAHHARVRAFGTLGARERRELLLQAAGYRYDEIAALSRGVRVNVAVLLGTDVGDMSPMEASRLRFVRSEAAGGAPRLLLLP